MKKTLALVAAITIALFAPLDRSPLSVMSGVAGLGAQATLNTTTLSAAVTVNDQAVTLASISTLAAGQIIVVDREAMRIISVPSAATSPVPVQRGYGGTAAVHASGSPVYTGPPNYFLAGSTPAGPCTPASQVALPTINLGDFSVWNCSGPTAATSAWQKYGEGGILAFNAGLLGGQASTAPTYTALGAIAIQPGLVYINGTTLAMTLANPATYQNGMIMVIMSTNASAQTITYTAGFNGGTTARDVATFGGAVGDNIVIIANNGVWWVISTRNVTLA